MAGERSVVASRACTLRAVSALAIASIALCLGWPHAFAAEARLMSVPLSFEPNRGQSAAEVQFLSRGSGYALFLERGKVVLNLERQGPAATADTVRMSLAGANPESHAVALAPQAGVDPT